MNILIQGRSVSPMIGETRFTGFSNKLKISSVEVVV